MTTAFSSRTRRRAALLSAAAASSLVLSGCEVMSPTQTQIRYAPADGVEIDGESLDVRDLLVVSHGNGAPAVISGSVVNQTSEPLTVTVTADGQELSPEITVPPDRHVRLDGADVYGDPGDPVLLPALEGPPGQSVEVRIDTESEAVSAQAPVLLPSGAYERYADEVGGPVTPPEPEVDDGATAEPEGEVDG